ncbi:MAG: hypothetical protein EBU90_01980 [Proteobacteria bacterium]|nr:hypothetical protein [Pseudomonadota bacterium]
MAYGLDFGNSTTVLSKTIASLNDTRVVFECPTPDDLKRNLDITLLVDYFKELLQYTDSHDGDNSHDDPKVVITAPVNFTDNERTVLLRSATQAGWNVIRIVTEPTAAALAYASHVTLKETETVLVIDSGGGTTDFSVVEMDHIDKMYTVLNTLGHSLGGKDLTGWIVEYIVRKQKITEMSPKQTKKLTRAADGLKQQLSHNHNGKVYIECFMGDTDLVIGMSRAELNDVFQPFYDIVSKCTLEVTRNTHVLDKVVLVGGTCIVPYLTTLCKINFPNATVCNDSPMTSVSIGASVLCAQLTTTVTDADTEMLLVDVLGASIGVETEGGVMSVVMSKNTPLGMSKTETFTNSDDYVDTIDINVYSGERRYCKDNTLLGVISLTGLDKTRLRGDLRIKVTLHVDTSGVVSVSAHDESLSRKVSAQFNRVILTDNVDLLEMKLEDELQMQQAIHKEKLYNLMVQLLTAYYNIPSTCLSPFTHNAVNDLFNYIFETLLVPCSIDLDYQLIKGYLSEVFHLLVFYIPEPGFAGSTRLMLL